MLRQQPLAIEWGPCGEEGEWGPCGEEGEWGPCGEEGEWGPGGEEGEWGPGGEEGGLEMLSQNIFETDDTASILQRQK